MKTKLDVFRCLEEYNITKAAAARAGGVTKQGVTNALTRDPRTSILLAVGNGLGIDMREFFYPAEETVSEERTPLAPRKTAAANMTLDINGCLQRHAVNLKTAADAAGFPLQRMSQVASGGYRPKTSTLYAIADGLGIDIREFFRPADTETEKAEKDAETTAAAEWKTAPRERMAFSVQRAAKERGLTIKALAERMGIAPQELSRQANGNPRLSLMERVAEALNCDITALFFPAGKETKE